MVHDVDDVAVWCSDEEPAHAPWLCRDRVHDLVADREDHMRVIRIMANLRVADVEAARSFYTGYSRTPVMAVLPWRTTEITECDAPRTQFGYDRSSPPMLAA
jgi:hypothetical protein